VNQRPVPKVRLVRALALVGALGLAAPLEVDARPGGGHSYSGGGGHSSSSSHSYSGGSRSSSHSWGGSSRSSSSRSRSSGGGGGHSYGGGSGPVNDFMALVCGLVFVFALLVWAMYSKAREREQRFDTIVAAPPKPRPSGPRWADLRARDPDFSAVLFEDFVYALYARAHAARSDPQAMAALAPYLAEGPRQALLNREPVGAKISGVIVGKLQVLRVTVKDVARVELVIEANYTAELAAGPQGHYVEERWALERAQGVTSKPPADVYAFACPSCGGPYQRSDEGRCLRCAQQVEDGRFDWSVRTIRVLRQETRPPALTGDVAEQGTNLPSVLEAQIERRYAAFVAEDPGVKQDALDRRVRAIYAALNAGWTDLDLRPTRPFVSDALYNYLSYWIEAYRAQGLRNVLEDMAISRVQVVKLTRDHHFDAITLRIWARGRDYTVAVRDGRRVSGNKTRPRAYSEYWTLIRGAAVRGAPRAATDCPNCGAPLDRVNMAGNCEYCGAHLTRGEFDWVLSKIEQDESYTG